MKLEMIDVLPTAWSPMKTSLYLRSALVEEAAAPADVGGATRLMCTHAVACSAAHAASKAQEDFAFLRIGKRNYDVRALSPFSINIPRK